MNPHLIPSAIEYLIRRKFPDYRALKIPVTLHGGGFMTGDDRARLKAESDAYKTELEAKPHDELEALWRSEQGKERTEQAVRSELEERQRPFNRPGTAADFVHWSKAAHWTLDEAIALCLGKDPSAVTWEVVKPYVAVSALAAQYHRIRDLAVRAIAWKQLYDPVLPGIFLAWALRNEFDPPTELIAQVEKRGIVVADWKDLYDQLKGRYDELLRSAAEYKAERDSATNENEDLKARLAEAESNAWDFDETDSTYPLELDIAMQAWRAATNSVDPNTTAKEKLASWVETNYPKQSREARERIAVMCNWEKSGGRPRRD